MGLRHPEQNKKERKSFMPKLDDQIAARVESAEGSTFEPLPDGAYHVRLRDVDGTGEGPKGPYWTWEFEVVEPDTRAARLWVTTSLSERSDWKLKETFAAFGVPTGTDTDELLGQVVKAIVGTRTQQEGAGKGQLRNEVQRLQPKDEDFEAATSDPLDPEDIFT